MAWEASAIVTSSSASRWRGAPEFELLDTGVFGGNSNWRGPIWGEFYRSDCTDRGF